MSDDVKKDVVKEIKETERIVVKEKHWFNRAWSAFTGLVVGVAAMFGINLYQVAETAQAKFETYRENVEQIKVSIEKKEWKEVKAKAVAFSKELTKDVPADKLQGSSKIAYNSLMNLIGDIEAGKYDQTAVFIDSILVLFKKPRVAENIDSDKK